MAAVDPLGPTADIGLLSPVWAAMLTSAPFSAGSGIGRAQAEGQPVYCSARNCRP